VAEDIWQRLQLVAAHGRLWGVSTDHLKFPERPNVGRFPWAVAARMVAFRASDIDRRDEWDRNDLRFRVRAIACPDSCDACKAMARRQFRMSDAPELPHVECSHPKGCRCTYVAVVL
jgi:hypothetical protein